MTKQYHKSKKVCLICPECQEKICGISETHAQENLKLHIANSNLHKKIKHALEMSGAKLYKTNAKGEVIE